MNQIENHEFITRELSQSEIQDRRYNLQEYLGAKYKQARNIAELRRQISVADVDCKRLDALIANLHQEIESGSVLERAPDRQQKISFTPIVPTLADLEGNPVADPREKPARKPRSRKPS